MIGGVVLAVAGSVVGEPLLSVTTLLCGLLGIGGVLVGVTRWKTDDRTPWLLIAATIALFLIGAISREASSNTGDLLDVAGYTTAILGVHHLGRRRAHDRDPTNLVDALIVIGGVAVFVWVFVVAPHLLDARIATSTKAIDLTFSVLSLGLAATVVRLAIGPGARNRSFFLFVIALVSALGNEVLLILDRPGSAHVIVGHALEMLSQVSFVALGAAALHPTMRQLTARSTVTVARMTRGRFVMMALAVLVPPVVLLFRLDHPQARFYGTGLVLGWMTMTGFVMVRMAGLVLARERLASLERALSRAAAGLVSATDRAQMYDAAITGMRELAGPRAARLRVLVASRTDAEWVVVAAHGHRAAEAMGRSFTGDPLDPAGSHAPVVHRRCRSFDVPGDDLATIVAAPLVSSNQVRGLLLYRIDGEVHGAAVDALGALAADVSLALETAALTEDLHRRRSQHRFQALIEHSSDVIVVLDHEGLVTYCSPSAGSVLGYAPDDLTGTDLRRLVHADDSRVLVELAGVLQLDQAARVVELRVRASPGDWKTFEVTLTDLRDDPDVDGLVVNAHDVTGRKLLEHDLRHRALHDDLTGMANRVLLRERVDHALVRRHPSSTVTAILFLDLDDFKSVNDGLGHEFGDRVLVAVADRLSTLARAGDTAARLGGDEFAMLLEDAHGVEDAMGVARRLLSALQVPIEAGGRELLINASVGVALADSVVDSSEVLLRNADVAMYYAKRTGKGRIRVFEEAMYLDAFERLELKGHLAQALEEGEMSLHYQPLVSLRGGEVLGFEALLRWDHPERGGVSPASFVPIAEEIGLIVPIGSWVLREAVGQLARWRAETGRDLSMSINLSPLQLEEDGIVEEVSFALLEAGVDPSCVTLELTESVVLEDGPSRRKFVELRQLGVNIAADDFGSGFASYAALQQLPFTSVKIDRSLIDGLDGPHEKALAQVRSIVEMAHATDLLVVAEGIEREAQRSMLAGLGCDIGQGYLLGRPAPAVVFQEVLRRGKGADGKLVTGVGQSIER